MNPVIRHRIHSGVRVVALGGAAAALLVGAPGLTWSADLSPNHRARIPLERTPVTAASLVCPGPELVGLAGSKDVRGTGAVIVAAPPLAVVREVNGSREVRTQPADVVPAGKDPHRLGDLRGEGGVPPWCQDLPLPRLGQHDVLVGQLLDSAVTRADLVAVL